MEKLAPYHMRQTHAPNPCRDPYHCVWSGRHGQNQLHAMQSLLAIGFPEPINASSIAILPAIPSPDTAGLICPWCKWIFHWRLFRIRFSCVIGSRYHKSRVAAAIFCLCNVCSCKHTRQQRQRYCYRALHKLERVLPRQNQLYSDRTVSRLLLFWGVFVAIAEL